MAKIAMVIARKDFRDEEYLHPKEEFMQNGHEVITASSWTKEGTGRFGAIVKPDINRVASTTQLGKVKIDGETITIDENGIIKS